MEYSEIAAEASPEAVRDIIQAILDRVEVKIVRPPSPAMVMVRQVDPLENIPFLLGEAFVTECEVAVDDCRGYGCVLGASDERALLSALLALGAGLYWLRVRRPAAPVR